MYNASTISPYCDFNLFSVFVLHNSVKNTSCVRAYCTGLALGTTHMDIMYSEQLSELH